MDFNDDLDALLDQVLDESLEDNTEEEVIRLILESIGANNTLHRSHRRRVVHCNQEEGHYRLFNEYFFDNLVYTETRIGESTVVECLQQFVSAICAIFKDEYIRKPNNKDIERLLQIGEMRGFPSMLGLIDCMH
uniref:Nuclease HARBI1 n=1 Tax=Cajanus cajan TaxID=3821 RepID=A0A151U7S9_CAJCA|nr:hypothetical protein KK1_008074 [Cajanus cajan]KYP75370.1 hypothetical protein KK1_008097 [Cajanus cajan]